MSCFSLQKFCELVVKGLPEQELKNDAPAPIGGPRLAPGPSFAKVRTGIGCRRCLPFAADADHTSAWGETHSDSASQRLTRCFERIFVRASQMRPSTIPTESTNSVVSSWKTIHPMIARPCSPHPAWQPMV